MPEQKERSWSLRHEGRQCKRLAELATEKGWELARIRGSHHVFRKEGRIERSVIPIHGSVSAARGSSP